MAAYTYQPISPEDVRSLDLREVLAPDPCDVQAYRVTVWDDEEDEDTAFAETGELVIFPQTDRAGFAWIGPVSWGDVDTDNGTITFDGDEGPTMYVPEDTSNV
jgi:hypothetical protein